MKSRYLKPKLFVTLTTLCTTLLAPILLGALPALAELEIKTTVTEFRVKTLAKPPSGFGPSDLGTTVWLEMTSLTEGKPLTGAEVDMSQITFTDSTGTDLFTKGKGTDARHRSKRGISKGAKAFGNTLVVLRSGDVGICRDEVEPGKVYLSCHALTTPTKEANGVTIKGMLTVYTDSGETKTSMITKEQLTSRKAFDIDGLSMRFGHYGGGVIGVKGGGRAYSLLEFSSFAALKKIAVVSESGDDDGLVVFDGREIEAFVKEIKDTDKIEITYSLPEKHVVKIDTAITMGTVGN